MPSSFSQSPNAAVDTVFSGLWIPLVTPFRDGAVDHPALAAMTAQLAQQGVSGFVACGSTGEAAALDKAEQLAVLETVLGAARGLPVVMGLSGYHLGQTVAWVQTLSRYPLAGLLVPAPHYIRPGQDGLLHWFRTLADASHVPLVLYDIPYRTGATLATETLLALAGHPHIRAIKDCGGNPAKTQALIADGRLAVLAGEDAQMFTTLALGGTGAIAASAHWQTPQFVELVALLRAGRLAEARGVWQAVQPWVAMCFAEPNPAPLKAVLAQAGWMRNELRAPMMPASEALLQRLQALPGISRP
ncbi:MAG: 4-hydroxy-tetrahydrodipicolinate synthase [Acidovorax sp.]|uniref:4-hydroxy-tetrahydrodipicolinate synthase n=1 Tax=Acidovorax sp. TaxID=1872122 RepID=UPI0025BEE6CC|nr:4-hydroxy-tetrahydrodipicolinate synthase [Acidovorax sp.]MCE1192372.1 4-hydroxy-tetrahydrodipicolinate synthase [Acidovorax sp.]